MGSAALRPSAALGRLLRTRRKQLKLTLRAVSERLEEQGERFPTSTLVRVEQGKLDPGVRRLHLLIRLYDLPPQLVADLIELEELAVEEPIGKDLEALHSEGIELWKRGDIAQALAYLFAIRVHEPSDPKSLLLKQKATLAFSIAARELGKLKLAQQLVNELLSGPPDPSLVGRTLIQASTVWDALGSSEMALALIRQAATHVKKGDHRQLAWIRHQEARLLLQTGKTVEASEALKRALAHYRKQGDTHGESKASIVRVGILEAEGELSRALSAARKAVRFAETRGHELPLISARLELGRLLVKSGSVEQGCEELRNVQAQAVVLEDRIAEFHAHYHLWKAHQISGDGERARFELSAARHFVEFIDAASPEAQDIQTAAEPRASAKRSQGGRRSRRW